jgi:hypothetical protein
VLEAKQLRFRKVADPGVAEGAAETAPRTAPEEPADLKEDEK